MPSTPKIKSVAPPITPMPGYTAATQASLAGQMAAAPTAASADPGRSFPNQPGSSNTNGVTNPFDGFSSRYEPSKVGEVYANPNMIAQDVLRMQGQMPTNSGMAAMGDYSQRMMDLAQLLGLTQGGGQNLGDETTINTTAELLANAMGPGGQAVDYAAVLELLMNPTAGGGLAKTLYGATGDDSFGLNEQNQALQPLFMSAITGMSPMAQRAAASAYRGAQNLAGQDMARGTGGDGATITNYLRQNLRGLVPGSIL